MDITALNRIAQAAPASVPAIPVDTTSQNREVVQAVKAINSTEMFGKDNQLTFQRDQATRRMVVKIVNRNTNEVVTQIPPEYVLRLAADMHRTSST